MAAKNRNTTRPVRSAFNLTEELSDQCLALDALQRLFDKAAAGSNDFDTAACLLKPMVDSFCRVSDQLTEIANAEKKAS